MAVYVKGRFTVLFGLLVCANGVLLAGTESIGPDGIDSTNLGLDGTDINIGMVESERSGKFGFDNGANSNVGTIPTEVYTRRGEAAMANAQVEVFDMTVVPPEAHATQVAGIMISSDAAAPGVAKGANLYWLWGGARGDGC